MKKNKKPFYVMVIVIIIMYAVIYILRPAPVSGQPVSGVFDQIAPVAPVQQPETTLGKEIYSTSHRYCRRRILGQPGTACDLRGSGSRKPEPGRKTPSCRCDFEQSRGSFRRVAGYDRRRDIPEGSIYIILGWRDGRHLGTVRGDVPGGKNGSRTERISGNLLFPGRSVV